MSSKVPSDDETHQSEKRIKLDTTDSISDVRSINESFPKIDNLEHFPVKVLLIIFEQLGDMDLYNLAEHSCRFESIAKVVLNDRYSHQYFIVDESKYTQETYFNFFRRFGKEIKAIEMRSSTSAWITLLYEANNLEKLTLDRMSFGLGGQANDILETVNESITHLTLRDCNSRIDYSKLFKFRNLKKIDVQIQPVISYDALAEVIRHNPALESLVLGEKFRRHHYTEIGQEYQFDRIMELIGTHSKQLKELNYTPRSRIMFDYLNEIEIVAPPDHIIDGFVNSLSQLQSLALSSNVDLFTDFIGLLRRINSKCKNIKHLMLYDINGSDIELFDLIRSFVNIESLALAFNVFGDEIELLVEHLPSLRHLHIAILGIFSQSLNWSFVLVLLRQGLSLEKLTIAAETEDGEIEMFGTGAFFNQFIEAVQKPNVELEVKYKDQIIGSISKKKVIWRNKLLRWMGCDSNKSMTKMNLLDLSKHKPSDSNDAEQRNAFDSILDYLDLKSLHSLSCTSKQCSQLVEKYLKTHSQQHGTFTITNEFNSHYDGMEMFAKYVINLKVIILHRNTDHLQYLLSFFHYLKKLYIYTEAYISLHLLTFPPVRHLIFDGSFGGYVELYELSRACKELETLELKKPIDDLDDDGVGPLEFHNLKKFTLKYPEYIQHLVENLKTIFQDTNTEVYLRI